MKQNISRLALVGVLGAALAGCSNGSGQAGAGTGAKDDAAGGTLSVLTYQTGEGAVAVYDEFFGKCSDKTGFTFKSLAVPQDELITKATQLAASGDAPGVIIADNNNVATLADAGLLAPIDLEAAGLDPADFVQGPLESGAYDGVQYGVPVGNNGEVIIYNKALLDEAGIAAPRSWDELTAAAKALTTPERYGFGQTFAPGETLTWNWLTQLWSNGGSLEDLGAPESVEAADFWTSFIRNGTAPTASLDWQATDVAAQVLGGQLAMGQVGTWTLPSLLADAEKAGVEIGITQQVSPDGSDPITPFGGEVLAAGAGATGKAADAVNECLASWYEDTDTLADYDNRLGYLPSYVPAQAKVLEESPELQVLADQLKKSRGRTTEVGAAYAEYTTAISTALQKVASGGATAEDAFAEAAASVK